MRFIILVRGNRESEAGAAPAEAVVAAMTAYHRQLAQAGILLDANGLQPSALGFRVRWECGRRTLIEGPFAASDWLVAGYTLMQVKSRAEGIEWVKRFPPPFGEEAQGEIEVRPLYELDNLRSPRSLDRLRAAQAPARK